MDRTGELAKYGYWLFGTVVFGLCMLVIGFGSGFNVGGGPPERVVEVQYKSAPHAQVVQSVPAQLPEDCVIAIEQMAIAYREAGVISAMADRQLDIMSAAQVAMLEHDFAELNKITSEQRTRNEKTDNAATALVEAQGRFKKALAGCKTAIGR